MCRLCLRCGGGGAGTGHGDCSGACRCRTGGRGQEPGCRDFGNVRRRGGGETRTRRPRLPPRLSVLRSGGVEKDLAALLAVALVGEALRGGDKNLAAAYTEAFSWAARGRAGKDVAAALAAAFVLARWGYKGLAPACTALFVVPALGAGREKDQASGIEVALVGTALGGENKDLAPACAAVIFVAALGAGSEKDMAAAVAVALVGAAMGGGKKTWRPRLPRRLSVRRCGGGARIWRPREWRCLAVRRWVRRGTRIWPPCLPWRLPARRERERGSTVGIQFYPRASGNNCSCRNRHARCVSCHFLPHSASGCGQVLRQGPS